MSTERENEGVRATPVIPTTPMDRIADALDRIAEALEDLVLNGDF